MFQLIGASAPVTFDYSPEVSNRGIDPVAVLENPGGLMMLPGTVVFAAEELCPPSMRSFLSEWPDELASLAERHGPTLLVAPDALRAEALKRVASGIAPRLAASGPDLSPEFTATVCPKDIKTDRVICDDHGRGEWANVGAFDLDAGLCDLIAAATGESVLQVRSSASMPASDADYEVLLEVKRIPNVVFSGGPESIIVDQIGRYSQRDEEGLLAALALAAMDDCAALRAYSAKSKALQEGVDDFSRYLAGSTGLAYGLYSKQSRVTYRGRTVIARDLTCDRLFVGHLIA